MVSFPQAVPNAGYELDKFCEGIMWKMMTCFYLQFIEY